jgi:hypothetical protein
MLSHDALSVIRVSDGEKGALDYCEAHRSKDLLKCFDPGFRARFGVEGITCGEIYRRIYDAYNRCTHFSPTLGFFKPIYDLTPYFDLNRKVLVDEMHQYFFSFNMRRELMQQAGHVLVINRDPQIVENLRSIPGLEKVTFDWLCLNSWEEAENVMEHAIKIGARLVLMSAALGSKYIGPRIAEANNSVVLDLGQAVEIWHHV